MKARKKLAGTGALMGSIVRSKMDAETGATPGAAFPTPNAHAHFNFKTNLIQLNLVVFQSINYILNSVNNSYILTFLIS